MNDADLVVIFCPPLSEYGTPPRDQSICELHDCPACKEKMWLSIKKKVLIEKANELKKEILLACYPCFIKRVNSDKELRDSLHNHTRIDL